MSVKPNVKILTKNGMRIFLFIAYLHWDRYPPGTPFITTGI
jgi:hypothetical protein